MQYARAPIVEAVLELRFQNQIDLELAQAAADKFSADFPIVEDQENFNVRVRSSGEVERDYDWKGRKRSSLDTADVIRVSTLSFTAMRLAPYLGWDQLFARTKENWGRLRKALRKPTISHLGCRYINRIDVPNKDNPGGQIIIDDYLNFGPRVPDNLGVSLDTWFIQAIVEKSDGPFAVRFHAGWVPSPLIAHTSFLLDIDVLDDSLSTSDDEEIWSRLNEMRTYKNKVFEACITDKSRKLFA